jgi:GGDEF domain-containing protein
LPGQHNYAGLSASIGIAFSHDNKVMFSQLMRAADAACYESKKQGRNQMTLSLIKTKN